MSLLPPNLSAGRLPVSAAVHPTCGEYCRLIGFFRGVVNVQNGRITDISAQFESKKITYGYVFYFPIPNRLHGIIPVGYATHPLRVAPRLSCPVEQHRADMTNCLGGIQAFGTHVDAVLNTVATEHAEGVIQLGQTVVGRGITTVGEKSVRLQQTGRTDKAVGVPPEGRTTG